MSSASPQQPLSEMPKSQTYSPLQVSGHFQGNGLISADQVDQYQYDQGSGSGQPTHFHPHSGLPRPLSGMPQLPPPDMVSGGNPPAEWQTVGATKISDHLTPSQTAVRGNTQKFLVPFRRTNVGKYSFFPDAARLWNLLPTSVVESPTLEAFKTGLSNTKLRN